MSWDHIDQFGMYDHSRKQQWQSTTNTDTEKAALERRIDELCEQVEHDRQTSRSRLERIDQLKAENAKLREQLAKARDPQRIGGTADPESFVYAIEQLREFRWQHATNDEDAIPYINNVVAAHERENAKLRKLLTDAWGYINHPADATWTHKKRKEVRDSIGDRMRELGVGVPE